MRLLFIGGTGNISLAVTRLHAKLKRFVPGFEAVVPFADGVAKSLAWFGPDPARQVVDRERDALLDRIVAAYTVARPSPA